MSWRVKGVRIVLIVAICAVLMRPFLATDLSGQASRIWEDRITSRDVELSGELEDLYKVDRIRSRLWIDTTTAILKRPGLLVIGAGFQNFRSLGISATDAHNQYLTALAELGVGGFLAFVLWLWTLVQSFHITERPTTRRRWLSYLPARSCLITLIALGLFSSVLYPARALPGFLAFALAYFGVNLAMQTLQGKAQVSIRAEQALAGAVGSQLAVPESRSTENGASSTEGDFGQCVY